MIVTLTSLGSVGIPPRCVLLPRGLGDRPGRNRGSDEAWRSPSAEWHVRVVGVRAPGSGRSSPRCRLGRCSAAERSSIALGLPFVHALTASSRSFRRTRRWYSLRSAHAAAGLRSRSLRLALSRPSIESMGARKRCRHGPDPGCSTRRSSGPRDEHPRGMAGLGPDAFAFERLVPSLSRPAALRVPQ